MSDVPMQDGELRRLIAAQNALLEELAKKGERKKDLWDRFATLSTFLSTVVIAGIGLYFTHVYNERQGERDYQNKVYQTRILESQGERDHQNQVYQTRILEMQTVEKFIPHLTRDEETKKVALLAVTSLGSPEFAARFAKLYPSAGTEAAGDVIMASASSPVQMQVATTLSVAAPAVAREGWAYLGHYDAGTGRWRTWYFEFKQDTLPAELRGRALEVRERTGALNVRAGMPTPDGRFPEIVEALKPGSRATVQEIREWHSTGYMWARISYGA